MTTVPDLSVRLAEARAARRAAEAALTRPLAPRVVPQDRCPVCHGGRTDQAAMRTHNLRVAAGLERSYRTTAHAGVLA